jgi:superfamily II DNA or RNA helicase
MKTLYKHQQRYMDERNRNRDLLVWEMQTGKTAVACEWIKYRKHIKILVVCPKSIVAKWKRELVEWGAVADVVSRDHVKKIDLKNYGGLVLDEAQDFASPLFTKQRSARAMVIYNYIKCHPLACVLLLSATPIRSTSWNLHTLACYLNVIYPFREFRDEFFFFTDMYGKWHYEPRNDWRFKIRPYLENLADIVLLKDCIDVPDHTHQIINIKQTKKVDKSLEWHERHRAEQSDAKWKELKALIDGYRKVIVVVYYKDQIDDYVKRIGNDRPVFVLDGRTKDQNQVIEDAKQTDDCVFLLQASMGAGFSAAEFSVMIFASMSFKYVDYIQATGRLNSTENIHKNNYIYLIGGECDKAVYDTIISGHDFNPHKYLS